MSDEPKGWRLDPELLAAYVDRRLPPEQRAEVEAQLASDPDSYAVLVDVMKAQDELGAEERRVELASAPERPSVRGRRTWIVAAGLLATAAALLLALRLQPDLLRRLGGGEAVDPGMATLVAAVGEERYIEARLSGGFKYGPLRAVARGPGDLSQQNLALLAAAGELQKKAREDPSPENLHAWGVAQLLLGDYDAAITNLEAAGRSSRAALVLSDISAGYSARAALRALPEDWPKALQAADQALALDPHQLEAMFNRGLALEGMQLRERAIEAWTTYVANDPVSVWGAEAQRRLRALQAETPRSEGVDQFAADVRTVASTGNDGLSNMVRDRAAAAFEWLLRSPVHVCGGADSDSLLASVAGAIGEIVNDRLFVDLYAEARRCHPGWESRWARIATLSTLIDADRASEARVEVAAVVSAGRPDWPVQNVIARYVRARVLYRDRDYAALSRVLDEAVRDASSHPYPILSGRLHHLLGLVDFIGGRMDESQRSLTTAVEYFQRARQWADRARMQVLLAEFDETTGHLDRAWDLLGEALQTSRELDSSRLRTTTYASAAALQSILGNYGAASALLLSQRQSLAPGASPVVVLVNRVATAEAYLGSGDPRPAREELDAAESLVETLRGDRRYQSLLASILATRARLSLRNGEAGSALELATRALSLTEPDRAEDLATYRLIRAEALGRAGEPRTASLELFQLLADIRQRRRGFSAFAQSALHRAVQQAAQTVAAGLIRNDASDDALDLLQFVQREQLGLGAASGETPRGVSRRPAARRGTVVLYLARVGDVVGSWSVAEPGRAAFSAINIDALTRELGRLDAAVRDRQPGALRASLASFDQLIFEPHRPALSHATRVVVVPDALTMPIPFVAVGQQWRPGTGRGLRVSVSPFFDAESARNPWRPPEALLAIGNENTAYDNLARLPNVPREVTAIAALYPESRTELAPAVSLRQLSPQFQRYRAVHIAAHSVVETGGRTHSRMVLGTGPENELTDSAIRLLRFAPGTVVVLSACSTAARGATAVDPVSLATSFIVAGAQSVVAALWTIPDAVAPDLFYHLHSNLRHGMSPADSVNETQRWAAASSEAAMALAGFGLTVVESMSTAQWR